MRSAFASIALAALAAANPVAVPQGVTSAITPKTTAPAGCSPNHSGTFQIQVVNVSSTSTKRSFEKRQSGALTLTLSGGILKDAQGRTGYIAANRQFQFDAPPQTGAIYTAGWSICSNGSLAIGGDAVFQQCLSGTFYNLYDEATSAQCSPVYIDVVGGSSSGAASVQSDGQATASPVASQQSDGQVTGSAAPVSQITDGQTTTKATAAAISQISDGQIQATTKATAAPVTQISDGQIQASTGRPISQISDGQIQASTSGSPVQQISDGQVQKPTSIRPTGATVSQIGDGQPQTNGTVASASPSVQAYTGAAIASYNPFLPLLALPAVLVGFVYAL